MGFGQELAPKRQDTISAQIVNSVASETLLSTVFGGAPMHLLRQVGRLFPLGGSQDGLWKLRNATLSSLEE